MATFSDIEKATIRFQKRIAKMCGNKPKDVHVQLYIWRAPEIVQECIDNGCVMHKKPDWFAIGEIMDPLSWTIYVPEKKD